MTPQEDKKTTCMDNDATMDMEEEIAKSPTKLGQRLSKLRVLSQNIAYLMDRVDSNTLSTSEEHVEILEEIHYLERILADCDAYVSRKIASLDAEHALYRRVMGPAISSRSHEGIRLV